MKDQLNERMKSLDGSRPFHESEMDADYPVGKCSQCGNKDNLHQGMCGDCHKNNAQKAEAKTASTPFKCEECGHKFKRKLGPNTVEVECPKCHGVDVLPTDFFGEDVTEKGLPKGEYWASKGKTPFGEKPKGAKRKDTSPDALRKELAKDKKKKDAVKDRHRQGKATAGKSRKLDALLKKTKGESIEEANATQTAKDVEQIASKINSLVRGKLSGKKASSLTTTSIYPLKRISWQDGWTQHDWDKAEKGMKSALGWSRDPWKNDEKNAKLRRWSSSDQGRLEVQIRWERSSGNLVGSITGYVLGKNESVDEGAILPGLKLHMGHYWALDALTKGKDAKTSVAKHMQSSSKEVDKVMDALWANKMVDNKGITSKGRDAFKKMKDNKMGESISEAKDSCKNCGCPCKSDDLRNGNCRKCAAEIELGDKLPGKDVREAKRSSNQLSLEEAGINMNSITDLFRMFHGQIHSSWDIFRSSNKSNAIMHKAKKHIEIVAKRTGKSEAEIWAKARARAEKLGPVHPRNAHVREATIKFKDYKGKVKTAKVSGKEGDQLRVMVTQDDGSSYPRYIDKSQVVSETEKKEDPFDIMRRECNEIIRKEGLDGQRSKEQQDDADIMQRLGESRPMDVASWIARNLEKALGHHDVYANNEGKKIKVLVRGSSPGTVTLDLSHGDEFTFSDKTGIFTKPENISILVNLRHRLVRGANVMESIDDPITRQIKESL
jgi:hypothetical protein